MDQDKRRQRELKRDIKQAGNRKRRRVLARDLQLNPEEAAHAEFDYGRQSSQPLNGIDRDTTRKPADGVE
jgi:hypothetical protein